MMPVRPPRLLDRRGLLVHRRRRADLLVAVADRWRLVVGVDRLGLRWRVDRRADGRRRCRARWLAAAVDGLWLVVAVADRLWLVSGGHRLGLGRQADRLWLVVAVACWGLLVHGWGLIHHGWAWLLVRGWVHRWRLLVHHGLRAGLLVGWWLVVAVAWWGLLVGWWLVVAVAWWGLLVGWWLGLGGFEGFLGFGEGGFLVGDGLLGGLEFVLVGALGFECFEGFLGFGEGGFGVGDGLGEGVDVRGRGLLLSRGLLVGVRWWLLRLGGRRADGRGWRSVVVLVGEYQAVGGSEQHAEDQRDCEQPRSRSAWQSGEGGPAGSALAGGSPPRLDSGHEDVLSLAQATTTATWFAGPPARSQGPSVVCLFSPLGGSADMCHFGGEVADMCHFGGKRLL
ncbi:MAG TPA: hypothetical protein VKG45_14625 [Actinomycetes bacterium]|nr:hypothetical protein [Actinomycetes bacterium]